MFRNGYAAVEWSRDGGGGWTFIDRNGKPFSSDRYKHLDQAGFHDGLAKFMATKGSWIQSFLHSEDEARDEGQ
jgi:hypothetical protein